MLYGVITFVIHVCYKCKFAKSNIVVTFVTLKHRGMQNRFKQLLEEKNLTANRFAALIKVNASAMSHILNGHRKPGFDVLGKIAQAFPDVNLNWLISGEGPAYNQMADEKPNQDLPLPQFVNTTNSSKKG